MKNNGYETKLTRYEQEVHLSIDEETKVWTAYVSSPYYMRRFERAGWQCVDTQYYSNGDVISKTYKAPKKCVIIAKEREKRVLTEEEKEKLRERVLLMQEAKFKKNSIKE